MIGRLPSALSPVGPALVLTAILLTGCPKAAGPQGAGGVGTGGAGGAGGGAASAPDAGGTAAATGTPVRGGPAPAALPSPAEFAETSALQDVHFDFDRYDIRANQRPVLDADARWLKSNAHVQVLIEGHADERGTNEYNLALGDRRAGATRDYLVQLGVEPSRITTVSYGEERPLCAEPIETCWARNRRGHLVVKQ